LCGVGKIAKPIAKNTHWQLLCSRGSAGAGQGKVFLTIGKNVGRFGIID
jgi:hypothetical protein